MKCFTIIIFTGIEMSVKIIAFPYTTYLRLSQIQEIKKYCKEYSNSIFLGLKRIDGKDNGI